MGNRLGQHFLTSSTTARKVVVALELKAGDIIIEVGAGHGELTGVIKNEIEKIKKGNRKAPHLTAIEKDPQLANDLRERFSKDTEIEILEGDARTILPGIFNEKSILYPAPYTLPPKADPPQAETPSSKLVGNIPYYLTGQILRLVSDLLNPPTLTVFMVQKEVAERIVAQPPHMNRLAAVSQCWADVKIAGIVSRGEFDPPPKVDSAIVVLKTRPVLPVSKETCFHVAKILFAQPRKMILSNLLTRSALETTTKEEILKILGRLGIDPRARPQNLGIEAIMNLARELF